MSKHLNQFLVELIGNNLTCEKVENDTILSWKDKITNLSKENEKLSPYSEFPTAESNTSLDIDSLIDKNETDSTKRKLVELV